MEAHISHIYESYVIDPQVFGLDSSIWKTVTGTPAISSSKYRLNAAEMVTFPQYRYGDFEFNVTLPAAPASSDDRDIGLVGKALGNRGRIAFHFHTDGVLYLRVYDKYGTLLFDDPVVWNASWTGVALLFRIGWSATNVVFTISKTDGTVAYTKVYAGSPNLLRLPLSLQVRNANSDNVDVASVTVMHSAVHIPTSPASSSTTTGASSFPALSVVGVGELQGVTSATQLPNVPCTMVKIKALSANLSNVYIGKSGVTAPDGTTDTTTGIELASGDDTGWLLVSNLNLLYRICDNAADGATYIALG